MTRARGVVLLILLSVYTLTVGKAACLDRFDAFFGPKKG